MSNVDADKEPMTAERTVFERRAYMYYVERHAAGKLEDSHMPPYPPEGLFWREPDGTYGVKMFNAAWWGFENGVHATVYGHIRRPSAPDFDAVRDKRMSELTPEQQGDAHELWLREQLGWFSTDQQRHLKLLLDRLDSTRALAQVLAATSDIELFEAAAAALDMRAMELRNALGIAHQQQDWTGHEDSKPHHDAMKDMSNDLFAIAERIRQ